MASDEARAVVLFSGEVQGVGFRYWTKLNADELGLKGMVRNLADGRVEAIFEGPKDNILHMLTKAKKGPSAADVYHIEVEYGDATGYFKAFDIER